MKHLDVVEDAGLIAVRRRWNHLNAVPLQRIVERWLGPYEAHLGSRSFSSSDMSKQHKSEPTPSLSAAHAVRTQTRVPSGTA